MKFYIGISPLLGIDSWQPMFLLGANSKKTLGGDSYGYLHFFFLFYLPFQSLFEPILISIDQYHVLYDETLLFMLTHD